MDIDDEINKTKSKLIKLKNKRIEETPSNKDFIKLIKVRFKDCINYFPLKHLGLSNKSLGSDLPIETGLMILFSFYAGRIFEDADQTGLYKGPAVHRVKTILNDYMKDLEIMNNNDLLKTPMDYYSRRKVYADLNSLGQSK